MAEPWWRATPEDRVRAEEAGLLSVPKDAEAEARRDRSIINPAIQGVRALVRGAEEEKRGRLDNVSRDVLSLIRRRPDSIDPPISALEKAAAQRKTDDEKELFRSLVKNGLIDLQQHEYNPEDAEKRRLIMERYGVGDGGIGGIEKLVAPNNLDQWWANYEADSTVDSLIESSPALATMMADPQTGVRLWDDRTKLQGIAHLMSMPSVGIAEGITQAEAGLRGALQAVPSRFFKDGANEEWLLNYENRILRYYGEDRNFLSGGLFEWSKQLPNMAGAIAAETGRTAVATMVVTPGPDPTDVAVAATAVGRLGQKFVKGLKWSYNAWKGGKGAGVLYWSSATEMGHLRRDLLRNARDAGIRVNEGEITALALAGGAAMGTIEAAGLEAMFKVMPGARTIAKTMMKRKVAELVTDRTFTKVLAQWTRAYITTQAAEPATEFVQEIISIGAEEAQRRLHPGAFEDATQEEVFERLWDVTYTTWQAMVVGGGFMAPFSVGGRSAYESWRRRQGAKKAASVYSRMAALTQDTKLAQEGGDQWLIDAIQRMGGEPGNVDTFYISAQGIKDLAERLDIDGQELAAALAGDDGQQYVEALEKDADIVAPIENVLARVKNPEVINALTDHIKIDQGGISLIQAVEEQEEHSKQVNEWVGRDMAEYTEDEQYVYDKAFEKYRAQLGDTAMADAQAKIAVGSAAVWAEQLQEEGQPRISLADAYDAYEITVERQKDTATGHAIHLTEEIKRTHGEEFLGRVMDGDPDAISQAAQEIADSGKIVPGARLTPAVAPTEDGQAAIDLLTEAVQVLLDARLEASQSALQSVQVEAMETDAAATPEQQETVEASLETPLAEGEKLYKVTLEFKDKSGLPQTVHLKMRGVLEEQKGLGPVFRVIGITSLNNKDADNPLMLDPRVGLHAIEKLLVEVVKDQPQITSVSGIKISGTGRWQGAPANFYVAIPLEVYEAAGVPAPSSAVPYRQQGFSPGQTTGITATDLLTGEVTQQTEPDNGGDNEEINSMAQADLKAIPSDYPEADATPDPDVTVHRDPFPTRKGTQAGTKRAMSRIAKVMLEGGLVDLRGIKVESILDVVDIGRAMRNPLYEIGRAIITDKDGNILAARARTAGLPGTTVIHQNVRDDGTVISKREQLVGLYNEAYDLSGGEGAVYYGNHNHPNTDMKPSAADVKVTQSEFIYFMAMNVLKMKQRIDASKSPQGHMDAATGSLFPHQPLAYSKEVVDLVESAVEWASLVASGSEGPGPVEFAMISNMSGLSLSDLPILKEPWMTEAVEDGIAAIRTLRENHATDLPVLIAPHVVTNHTHYGLVDPMARSPYGHQIAAAIGPDGTLHEEWWKSFAQNDVPVDPTRRGTKHAADPTSADPLLRTDQELVTALIELRDSLTDGKNPNKLKSREKMLIREAVKLRGDSMFNAGPDGYADFLKILFPHGKLNDAAMDTVVIFFIGARLEIAGVHTIPKSMYKDAERMKAFLRRVAADESTGRAIAYIPSRGSSEMNSLIPGGESQHEQYALELGLTSVTVDLNRRPYPHSSKQVIDAATGFPLQRDTDTAMKETKWQDLIGHVSVDVLRDTGGRTAEVDGNPDDGYVSFAQAEAKIQEQRSLEAGFMRGEFDVSDSASALLHNPSYLAKLVRMATDKLNSKALLGMVTPLEARKINTSNINDLVEAFADIDAEELSSVAYAARAKKGWYYKSAIALTSFFGLQDAPRFAALLAATSPQTSVRSNFTNALTIWKNWIKAGRPTEHQEVLDLMMDSVQHTEFEAMPGKLLIDKINRANSLFFGLPSKDTLEKRNSANKLTAVPYEPMEGATDDDVVVEYNPDGSPRRLLSGKAKVERYKPQTGTKGRPVPKAIVKNEDGTPVAMTHDEAVTAGHVVPSGMPDIVYLKRMQKGRGKEKKTWLEAVNPMAYIPRAKRDAVAFGDGEVKFQPSEEAAALQVNKIKHGADKEARVANLEAGLDARQKLRLAVLDAWINNSVRALAAPNPEQLRLSGAKVTSFMLNLRGWVNEVTNDTLMATFHGLAQTQLTTSKGVNKKMPKHLRDPGKSTLYIAISAKSRIAAKILTETTGEQWHPMEIQETVWSYVRLLKVLMVGGEIDGEGKVKGDREATAQSILEAGGMTHERIASVPDFASLMQNNVIAKIIEEIPGGTENAKRIATEAAELARTDVGGDALGGNIGGKSRPKVAESTFHGHLRSANSRITATIRQGKDAREAGILDYQSDTLDLHEALATPPSDAEETGVIVAAMPAVKALQSEADYSAVPWPADEFVDALTPAGRRLLMLMLSGKGGNGLSIDAIAHTHRRYPKHYREMPRALEAETIGGFEVDAWHAGPVAHRNFNLNYIGTGDGGAVYGWGFYYAEEKRSAETFTTWQVSAGETKLIDRDYVFTSQDSHIFELLFEPQTVRANQNHAPATYTTSEDIIGFYLSYWGHLKRQMAMRPNQERFTPSMVQSSLRDGINDDIRRTEKAIEEAKIAGLTIVDTQYITGIGGKVTLAQAAKIAAALKNALTLVPTVGIETGAMFNVEIDDRRLTEAHVPWVEDPITRELVESIPELRFFVHALDEVKGQPVSFLTIYRALIEESHRPGWSQRVQGLTSDQRVKTGAVPAIIQKMAAEVGKEMSNPQYQLDGELISRWLAKQGIDGMSMGDAPSRMLVMYSPAAVKIKRVEKALDPDTVLWSEDWGSQDMLRADTLELEDADERQTLQSDVAPGPRRYGDDVRGEFAEAWDARHVEQTDITEINGAPVRGQLSDGEHYVLEDTPVARQVFADKLRDNAATHPFGKSVTVKEADDYIGSTLFTNADMSAIGSIDENGDAGSLSATYGVAKRGAGGRLRLATLTHAMKANPDAVVGHLTMDSYETKLPHQYVGYGWWPVARVEWNDEFAPEDWDYEKFANWNDGKPGVLLYVFEPNRAPKVYSPEAVPTFDSWDEAVAARDRVAAGIRRTRRADRPDPTQTAPFKKWFKKSEASDIGIWQWAQHVQGSRLTDGQMAIAMAAAPPEDATPVTLFHGGSNKPSRTGTFSDERMVWGSVMPRLANKYSEMAGSPVITPLHMSIQQAFNADGVPKYPSYQVMFNSILTQARRRGKELSKADVAEIKALMNEAGDYFNKEAIHPSGFAVWQYWHGSDNQLADIFRNALEIAGFDGIRLTEEGNLTFGVFTPSEQAKSATAHIGAFEGGNMMNADTADVPSVNKSAFDSEFVEAVPVSTMLPYIEYDRTVGGQPRIDELKESIGKDGIKEPLILEWSQATGRALITEGNHRLAAAVQLGLTHVPVRVVRRMGPHLSESLLPEYGGGRHAVAVPSPPTPNRHGYVPGDMRPSDLGIAVLDRDADDGQFRSDVADVPPSGDPLTIHVKAEPARGSVVFHPTGREFNIGLFDSSDASTPFHEMAHVYMEVLADMALRPNASEQTRNDYQRMMAFLAKKTGATLKTRADIRRVQAEFDARDDHNNGPMEVWARAFEKYIFEGNSPSLGLMTVFSKTEEWLSKIYGANGQGLDIEISDSVRGVFDRLLATRQEIAEAKRKANLQPHESFRDTMTDAEYQQYMKNIELAAEEDRAELRKLLMEPEKRKLENWYKNVLAQVTEQVEEDMNEAPLFRLLRFLENGEIQGLEMKDFPDGLLNAHKDRLLKLHRHELETLFGKEEVAKLPKKFVTNAEGRHMSIYDAAIMFGFASPEQMMQAMTERDGSYDEMIQAEVDGQMQARYGDLLERKSELAEEAAKVVSSQRRVSILMSELAALRRSLKAGEYLEGQKLITPGALKAKAQELIARTKVALLQPHVYMRNYQKYGEEAFRQLDAGNEIKAYEAKREQLWNLIMYRAARDAQKKADQTRRLIREMSKKKKRKDVGLAGRIENGEEAFYLDILEHILATIDNRQMGQAKARAVTGQLDQGQLDARAEALRARIVGQEDRSADVLIIPEGVLRRTERTHVTQLTGHEINELHDALANLNTLAMIKLTALKDGKRVSREEALKEMIDRIVLTLPVRSDEAYDAESFWGGVRDKANQADTRFIRIEELIRQMDGGDPNGPFAQYFFQSIAAAEHRAWKLMAGDGGKTDPGIVGKVVAALDKVINKRSVKDRLTGHNPLERLRTTNVYIPALDMHMTREMLVMIALNSGTESNYQRMRDGGVRDINNNNEIHQAWNEDVHKAILEMLTPDEWRMVQDIWKSLESLWPELYEHEFKNTGQRAEKVPPRSWRQKTSTGEMITVHGGYFPLKYDSFQTPGGITVDSVSALSVIYPNRNMSAFPVNGSMQKRVEKYDKPVDIRRGLGMIGQHLVEVIHDLTHREAVTSIASLMRDDTLMQALKIRLGERKLNLLIAWVGRVGMNQRVPPGQSDPFAGGILQNFNIAVMAGKWTIAFQNLANVSLLMAKTGTGKLKVRDFGKAAINSFTHAAKTAFTRNPNESIAFVHKHSLEMEQRFSTLDHQIRQAIMDMMATPGHRVKKFMLVWGFSFIRLTDALIAYPGWMAKFDMEMQKEEKGPRDGIWIPGEKEYDAAAHRSAMAADHMIRSELGSNNLKDIPEVLREGGMGKLMLFAFSWFSAQYSVARRTGHEIASKRRGRNLEETLAGKFRSRVDPVRLIAAMSGVFWTWIFQSTVPELMAGRGPDLDDDDEVTPDEFMTWLMAKVATYPLLLTPLSREVGGPLEAWMLGDQPRARAGIVGSVAIDTVRYGQKALESMSDGEYRDALLAVNNVAGKLLGYPSSQTGITLDYWMDLYFGDVSPESTYEVIHDSLYRRPKEENP